MEGFLPEILINVISVIISAVIVYFLALPQCRKNRWWDTRLSAYMDIIHPLSSLKEYGEVFINDGQGELRVGDDERKRLHSDYIMAIGSLRKAVNVTNLLFSPLAQKEIDICLGKVISATKAKHWVVHLTNHYEAMDGVIEKVVNIAKEDLNLK